MVWMIGTPLACTRTMEMFVRAKMKVIDAPTAWYPIIKDLTILRFQNSNQVRIQISIHHVIPNVEIVWRAVTSLHQNCTDHRPYDDHAVNYFICNSTCRQRDGNFKSWTRANIWIAALPAGHRHKIAKVFRFFWEFMRNMYSHFSVS